MTANFMLQVINTLGSSCLHCLQAAINAIGSKCLELAIIIAIVIIAKLMDDATKAKGNRPKFATNVPKDEGTKAIVDILEPETLKLAKLSMNATPIQFKNWEYDFLAYFESINGNKIGRAHV